jgi:hypothetical protein
MALARSPVDNPDRAIVLATLCSELAHNSPLERRRELANEALAIAGSSGDDAAMVRVLNHVFVPLFVPHLLKESLDRSDDALVRAERLGDPLLLFSAADWRAIAAARAGDVAEMDRCLEIAGSLVQQLDQPIWQWAHTITRAQRAMIAGDIGETEQLAVEAFQIGTDSGQPDATIYFGAELFLVNFQRGTLGTMIPQIEEMSADAPGIPPLFIAGLLATAHVEAGRLDDARNILAEFEAASFILPLDRVWFTAMSCYAEAAIECRDPAYAEPIFDRLSPFFGLVSTVGGITAEGPSSHFIGGLASVLGRYDEADTYFAQSAAMGERMGAKFFTARTDLLWGKMLVERHSPGDIEKARDLLTKSHTLAVANQYGNVERRAASALQSLY